MREFIENLDDLQKVILAILWTGFIHFLIKQFFVFLKDLWMMICEISKIPFYIIKYFKNSKRSKINLKRYE